MKNYQRPLALALFALIPFFVEGQTNVRAWYADGQVWVVWNIDQPLPETYAIFAKQTAFASTVDAAQVGRLFREEYLPGAMKEQVDTSLTYKIPGPTGGSYLLKADEGLFVFTPHQAGKLFFAVKKWGETAVSAQNITPGAVNFQFDPVGDPVECHLQKTFISPFDQNYVCFAFYMWADGRQEQWDNRPDFPVMANAAKNGMPSFFMISALPNLDTTNGIALSVWLHGGGGTARQSLAGSRQEIRLNPKQGILLAHNDDCFAYLLTFFNGFEGVSKHFGWRKNFDPFTGAAPTAPDTVVNYTQRRYLWTDEWLIKHYPIDPARIHINGHSMGSRGATMMAKAFPDHYASATILNNGGEDSDPLGISDVMYGPTAMKFPSNLTGYDGKNVPFHDLSGYTTRLSDQRDLPLMRFYHSKNDNDGTSTGNSWDANVVANFRAADSLGFGAQLNWSERKHGPDTGPDFNDHWISGIPSSQQTVLDDIAYEEENFRSDVSFPAFFNHRLDAQNNDPGTGQTGINNGDGDNWGTWGGYHRWDWDNISDLAAGWSAVAWLESGAVFGNDNCPQNSLTADVAIRKPVAFKPLTGKTLNWNVKDVASGNTLQSGTTVVKADNLVVVPEVKVFRESIRRVRISVIDPTLAAGEAGPVFSEMKVSPNPASGEVFLPEGAEAVRVLNLGGKVVFEKNTEGGAANLDVSRLPGGLYFLEVFEKSGAHRVGRFVKI